MEGCFGVVLDVLNFAEESGKFCPWQNWIQEYCISHNGTEAGNRSLKAIIIEQIHLNIPKEFEGP